VLGIRHAILLAIVPGILAATAITVAADEARRTLRTTQARRTLALNLRELRAAGLGRVLTPVAFLEPRQPGHVTADPAHHRPASTLPAVTSPPRDLTDDPALRRPQRRRHDHIFGRRPTRRQRR